MAHVIVDVAFKMCNPYTPSRITSQSQRDPKFRRKVGEYYGQLPSGTEESAKWFNLTCMITGTRGSDKSSKNNPDGAVIVAHITPLNTPSSMWKQIGITQADINHPRNALILLSKLESLFDRLQNLLYSARVDFR